MIEVEGIVQGVGFRPYVHRLATARALDGFVYNDTRGLLISVQGSRKALDDFVSELASDPPPLSSILSIRTSVVDVAALDGFSILDSGVEVWSTASSLNRDGTLDAPSRTSVSPDVATCQECLSELFDPADRRHRFPFINCTRCGPRFTIIKDLPYDRPKTTMAGFSMCQRCCDEYEDPANRRFHAQPIACHDCGPTMSFRETRAGRSLPERDVVSGAADALVRGKIVGIKGLGGYHVACDATNADAVRLLRARKHREARPLALMVRDIAAASALCHVSSAEMKLLESRERPIVLLRRKTLVDPRVMLALDEAAPRAGRLGLMLPYTPLHHLIMESVDRPLVMTSGNLSDEPIVFDDAAALSTLGPIVDSILLHDRPIASRCDDTVMLMALDEPMFIRRSRGFAPRAIATKARFCQPVLAVGGQLKNTFCLASGSSAFLSHHIGDLGSAASYESLASGIGHLSSLVGVDPQIVVHDLHPDYMSTRLAGEMEIGVRIGVQHHHAHIASCMAEHGLVEPAIGVAFDGAGLGDDGATWGGEFLLVDPSGYSRAGRMGYVPLPGGDAAARHPLRMAMSHLSNAFGEDMGSRHRNLINRLTDQEQQLIRQMLEKGINSPPTSSIGRLFDAVAALIGIRDVAQFEGQAAMELEALADWSDDRIYDVDISNDGPVLICDPGSVIRGVVGDLLAGVAPPAIASAFHNTLARLIEEMAQQIRDRSGVNRIALSGGVFQNVLLVTRSAALLERAGFEVFTQRLAPCNDGGLALGQAYIVALRGEEN